MSSTPPPSSDASSSGSIAKLLIEVGPLIVFYGIYFRGAQIFGFPESERIFVATGAFLAAFAAAFIASYVRERTVSPMLMVSGAIVAVMGGLTLILQNATFVYMKPTLVNLTFASILGGGLVAGRMFLKTVFGQAFSLPDAAWRTLTFRFIGFFIFLAALNEVVWRSYASDCVANAPCDGEEVWVNFKTFGVLPLTLLFTMAQTPFIMKHNQDDAS